MSKTKQKKVNPYAKQPEKKTNWPLIIVAAVLVAALIVAGVLLLGGKHKNTADDGLLHGTYYAQIDVKDYGTITAELYADTAPITVTNFVNLVNQGFYDGLTFHRIIKDFMIQGGCPLGTGTGGPGYNFDDEIVPGLTFDRPYLLAMANAGLRRGADGKIHGTNGSQFFITTVPTEWLNGHHTIFGEVADDESKAVVDKLDSVATDRSDAPLEPVGITSIEVLK